MNRLSYKELGFLLLLGLYTVTGFSQINTVGVDSDIERLAQRLQILNGDNLLFHASVRRYDPRHVTNLLKQSERLSRLSRRDAEDLQLAYNQYSDWTQSFTSETIAPQNQLEKVFSDSTKTFFTYVEKQSQVNISSNRVKLNDKPLFGIFYKNPAHFYEYDSPFFKIKVNPLLNFKIYNAPDDDVLFENQRGISLRGSIDDKLFYYVSILESQARYSKYVRDFERKFLVVPGAGFYKNYDSTVFTSNNAYDYFLGEGHVGINVTEHIGVQFGHGRHFIGSGMRSLLLSDFSTNYLYLKFDTRVWKFHYQNIFAELQTEGTRDSPGDERIPTKYMATHYLTLQVAKNFDIGIFESVIFARANQFEFQYLNPLILYRTVEGAIGSPDNVILGMNANWNFLNHFSLYGQIVLDEFKFNELTNGNGWWANKYGAQLGVKYINAFGVDHLDLQAEYNVVRPYTYTHKDSTSNYSHYNQSLAHPLGANFKEILFKARYSPTKKWSVEAFLMRSSSGDDDGNSNFGSNVLIPNGPVRVDRPYGNFVGQGLGYNVLLSSIDVSYQVYQNVFLDLRYQYRKKDSVSPALDRTDSYIGGGVRINLSQRRDHY